MSLYLRDNVYWMSYRDATGRRVQRSTSQRDEYLAKIAYAQAVHNEARARLGLPVDVPVVCAVTLDEAIKRWNASRATRGRDAMYLYTSELIVRKAAARMRWHSPSDITAPSVEGYLTITSQTRAARTVNAHRATISGLCEYCVAMKWIGHNPVRGVPPLKDKPAPRRALQPSEAMALIAQNTTNRDVWAFLILTGLRRAEAEGLKDDMDRGDHLVLPGSLTKSGQDERVPVGPTLRGILQTLTDGVKVPSVKVLIAEAQVAGIDTTGLTVHGLRHTTATLLHAAGVDLVTAANIMRHKSLGLTGGTYTHVPLEKLIEAQDKVAAVLYGMEVVK